jgi:signal transduction histidine kinase
MLMKESTAPAVSADRPLVIVIDDEYGPRESIAFTLSTEFAVDTAERASEALAKLKQRSYAAVVMDIRMPEMDGIRALEELRKIDSQVSVIMLTGYGTLLTAQQAMLAGANQYLRKPPDVAELRDAVRQQVEATRMRRLHEKLAMDAQAMNVALKSEIERNEPQIWQARASVELVHDLNNPLTVVIGYATLLAEEARRIAAHEVEMASKLTGYAEIVEKAAEYCHHLSENWRSSFRKLAEFGPVDLVSVAEDVRQVLFFGNPAIRNEGLPNAVVRGSKYELMRIFQNTFKNALEAGATALTVTFSRQENNFEVLIVDNGSGMDADRVRRALRGGFSSKPGGTGLGLSICRHLIGAHGGTFELTSAHGKGTTIRIVVPVAREPGA